MRLLLDQNLSYRLVNSLQNAYPGTSQCYLLGLDKSDDYSIWQYAKDNDFVIVTKDSNFHELSLIYDSLPKATY
jgi:predicted nuclease of predicted toxin-antitoxin system